MSARTRKKVAVPASSANGLFPDEETDIRKEIETLVADPNKWIDMPNTELGGTKPKDLIGTNREQMLRDLLRSIKYGIPR